MLPLSRVPLILLVPAATLLAADPISPTALSKENVFAGPAAAAGPAQAASETIEFVGVSTIGKHTDLIFLDKTSKKSHWIAKGDTVEGITLLNYDAQREEAVVKINGSQKTLPLRQGAKPGAAGRGIPQMAAGFNVAQLPQPAVLPTQTVVTPAVVPPPPVPTPVAPPQMEAPKPPEAPSTPEAVKKAETEARMLVSDLLEIGMQQRKAYEEAQRKAAEGVTNQATPTASQQPNEAPK